MKAADIIPGKRYKIKDFMQRPAKWNSEGSMDRYIGRIVTIRAKKGFGAFYIEQDPGDDYAWTFTTGDFENTFLDEELFEI